MVAWVGAAYDRLNTYCNAIIIPNAWIKSGVHAIWQSSTITAKKSPLKTSRRLLLSNFISAPLHRTVGCLLLRWLKILATSSLRRYSTANNAEHLITSTKKNLYPQSSDEWNNFGKFSHKFYFRSFTFLLYLNTDFRGCFRLKLSPTSGGCPRWLILFKGLLYQNKCKEYMNIGGC